MRSASAGAASLLTVCWIPLWSPFSTGRKGRKVQDSGEPVAARAARLAAAKNLLHPGTASPSLHSHVRFVLPSLPDSHLVSVLVDVGVSFGPHVGSPCTLLSLVRANEVVQDAISKAKEVAAWKRPSLSL